MKKNLLFPFKTHKSGAHRGCLYLYFFLKHKRFFAMSSVSQNHPGTAQDLTELYHQKIKIAILTCYDASFACLFEEVKMDAVMVGDSLGMVIQGKKNTLGIRLKEVAYHVRCVRSGAPKLTIIADLPFGSYQKSKEQAYHSSVQLMNAGASMVKMEGGVLLAETVNFLTQRGISVCGHIGLTPQSVFTLGGYRVQGKEEKAQTKILQDAKALEQAGADLLVLEAIPRVLAKQITEALSIPTIGIGAAPECSGQVLVLYDLLGVGVGKKPKFVKNFLTGQRSIQRALEQYILEVKTGTFPAAEHCY